MNDEFVTLEQIKQLRELGFDQWGGYIYQGDTICPTWILSFDYRNRDNCNPCPTLYNVQRWLRERKPQYKILITRGDFDIEKYGWIIYTDFPPYQYLDIDHGNSIDTYEEALSNAIDMCITLMKENKEKGENY